MQNSKLVKCQNCKAEFTIEPQDFKFYEKISPAPLSGADGTLSVPPPTFCPECRLQRRLAWRNERTLYQRKCDLCKKEIIGMYHKEVPFPVYCNECWWSDKWNPLSYGQAYDFSKPFFTQFYELMQKVPRFPFFRKQCKNCDYVNVARDSNDCYLLFGSVKNEDCCYGKIVWNCKNVLDALYCYKCEFCYQVIDCIGCSNLLFSKECTNCRDSAFLEDCINCSDCFLSVGLRNKQYYFENQKLTKEEYEKRVAKAWENLSSLSLAHTSLRYPKRFARFLNSIDSTGDHLLESKRALDCFDLKYGEGCKYIYTGNKSKDCYDCSYLGYSLELGYEAVTVSGYNVLFSLNSYDNFNVSYSIDCSNSENLFGCIGVSKGRYCVLNKQYAKEAYQALVPKIITHMNEMPYIEKKSQITNSKSQTNSNDQNPNMQTKKIVYRYGEFFPIELSPFGYNESVAQENFPLTKEEAGKSGYTWKDPEMYQRATTLIHNQLPDHIKDVPDSILNEVIGCAHASLLRQSASSPRKSALGCNEQCTTAFRIIPAELKFYRKFGLPLPRLCPNCRHYERLKKRNPFTLWHRKCMCQGQSSASKIYQNTIEHFHKEKACLNEFKTSYSPQRSEIVYCEQCYLAEVV
ncbi:MAG: hypothetical protein HY001_03250 [Candidatus Portnoybacteria bacterium]|nr:hypothetical protein [Candidatus Portnoybacteria bacterium]